MSASPPAPSPIDSNTILRLVVDAAPGLLAYFEAGTLRCRFANQGYASYYGLTPASMLDKRPWEILGQDSWQAIAPYIERCMRGEPVCYVRHAHTPQGTLREMEVSLTPHLEQGVLCGAVVQVRDLSLERAAEQRQRESEERMRQFSEATHEAIVLHRHGLIIDANPALLRMTGYSLDKLRGQSVINHLSPQYWLLALKVMHSGHDVSYEATVLHKDGHAIAVEIEARSMPMGQGAQDCRLMVIRDITARQKYRAQVQFLARHDALTGLPNRLHLTERLQQLLTSAHLHHTAVTVLYLDLKHFTTINDSLGHEAGDQVLHEVAQRLLSCVRHTDLVARAGSDEFIVVLAGGPTRQEAETITRQMTTLLEMPCHVAGQQLVIVPSIGIAMFPEDGNNVEALLRNAGAACNLAKDSGHNHHQFYTPALEGRASRMLDQEQLLRQAIALGGFELHYQPLVRTDNGALAGFEALVRWHHPQRGLVGPEEFVPFAEARGLITAIDRWVLRQACSQAQAWHALGLPRVPMAVNMSALEFRFHDLAAEVATVLAETGLPAQLLHLELTESTLMQSDAQVQHTLHTLQQLGVELAIDDFGTGYSSLAYLKRHPIHQLKIDRSFISDIAESDDDAAIVKAIVQMAHSLRLHTVGEGVETAAQFERLRTLGCEMVQGFYIAAPMPAEEARQWQTKYCHARQAQ